MIEEKLSRSSILKQIEEKEITAKEGLNLLKELKKLTEVNKSYPSSVTRTFHGQWEEESFKEPHDSGEEEGQFTVSTILLFDHSGERKEQLAADKDWNGLGIILIKQGEIFLRETFDTYVINPASKEDYIRLFTQLSEENRLPEAILHLWAREEFYETQAFVKNQLEESFYSLLYISQGLMQVTGKTKRKVFFVYETGRENPIYAAVSGFAKTIRLENPNLDFKVVSVQKEEVVSEKGILSLLRKELQCNSTEVEIKYSKGKRFTKKYSELQLPDFKVDSFLIKEGGTYLITGGAGGIGCIIARYLAVNYHANCILTGRTPLNDSKKQVIDELIGFGVKAVYICSDLTNEEDLDNIFEECIGEFGKLDGIFHLAGVLRDTLARSKTFAQTSEVFSPKIQGSIVLHEKLKRYKADFLVLFSGLASILGNVGQSDYAYAGAFLDNYAAYLSKELPDTKILSINWPLWENGGMQIEKDLKDGLFHSYGLVPLRDKEGIEILLKSLSAPYNQIIVVHAAAEKAEGIDSLLRDERQHDGQEKEISAIMDTSPSAQVYTTVEEYLKEIIAAELKLKKEQIIASEPWEKYGIDSMSIVKMTNQIEKVFKGISKTLFFEYQNLSDLIEYFIHNKKEVITDKLMKTNQVQAFSIGEAPLTQEKGRIEKSPGNAFNESDIAIIGISGKYPMAENLEQYWENLKSGVDCITEIPTGRWDYEKDYSKEKGVKGKTYSKWGGFLSEYDKFDPLFFGITPRDAEMMDPQERLFLEVVWQTMEDAGYNTDKLKKYEVGVYAGVMYGHYQIFGAEETLAGNAMALSSSYASIANRVSYMLDLKGPSLAIDTMCSSSLTTIHLACESIRRGECQMAVAGGVNLTIHPTKHQYLCANNFASSDGRCKSFGEGGDGYVPGEGVGAVLIKSLQQAEADKDHIYAVIKASAINHGGRTNGYTVPNPVSQGEVIAKTLEKAHINPRAISYLEAHGTGTSLGDPIEITGLTKAFHKYTKDNQFCAIGSVKSNIGHTEAAAGIAGLTKILLQMKHKQLVPSIHSEKENPNINFSSTPFYVQKQCTNWEQPMLCIDGKWQKTPRIAGISAFGAGGSNAHVILEEYPDVEEPFMNSATGKPFLFVLSARNEERLKEYTKRMLDYLKNMRIETEGDKDFHTEVTFILCQLIGQLLEIEVAEVKNAGSFAELNMDMIKLNILTEKINQRFEMDIALQEVLNNASVHSLTDYLCSNNTDKVRMAEKADSITKEKSRRTIEVNLEKLAFTLQTGREVKENRLAVIAASTEELQEKLTDYCRDRQANISFFTTNSLIKEELSDEESTLQYSADNQQKENLLKLAKRWIKGEKIDWDILYGKNKPGTIALPTYPFEKKRYWYNSFSNLSNGFEAELEYSYAENNYKGNEVTLQVIDESIALITMQDEKNRNMFSNDLIFGLMAKFAEVHKDSRIKAIIITGYGNIFSMGGTQEQLLNIADQKNRFTDAPFLYRGLLESPIPVIAAIQGHATGGGLLFGLFADIVIMAKEGIYSAVFAKYGFTPGMGATYILKKKFGINLSNEMMYTAKSYSGEELYEKGASVTFKKSEEVLKEAFILARSLAEKPLLTLTTLKSELAGEMLRELPEYIKRENEMHEKTFTKSEVKDRIRYFYLEDKDFTINGIQENQNEKSASVKKVANDLESMLKALEDGDITPEEALNFEQKNVEI
jgi:3-oxoacyl-(acyl-carrier-protein) synthase/enoyl-CoA hydratase/carnithine racemase/NADP-dependent 3-hydroxy acid dehydrogenase YdfG/acyl carrier protein